MLRSLQLILSDFVDFFSHALKPIAIMIRIIVKMLSDLYILPPVNLVKCSRKSIDYQQFGDYEKFP
jgi:hypothetical protein